MSVAIEINPVWSEEQQKQVGTMLVVTIDLSNVQSILEQYNLLLHAVVKTSIPIPDSGLIDVKKYSYTFIEEKPGRHYFSFETMVLGVVEDLNQIEVFAKGYYIRR